MYLAVCDDDSVQLQAVLWYLFGNEAVRQLYPLITHLPLILALIFLLKKTPGVAVVSVATAVYTDFLELDSAVFAEFLPTSLIVFYVAFLTAYHVLSQDRAQAQLQSSMLDAEPEQSRTELETLRRGVYAFEPEKGLFTLRVVLPLESIDKPIS